MKIWVVEGVYDYEYSCILGVYSTDDKAEGRVCDPKRPRFDEVFVHELILDEDCNV